MAKRNPRGAGSLQHQTILSNCMCGSRQWAERPNQSFEPTPTARLNLGARLCKSSISVSPLLTAAIRPWLRRRDRYLWRFAPRREQRLRSTFRVSLRSPGKRGRSRSRRTSPGMGRASSSTRSFSRRIQAALRCTAAPYRGIFGFGSIHGARLMSFAVATARRPNQSFKPNPLRGSA